MPPGSVEAQRILAATRGDARTCRGCCSIGQGVATSLKPRSTSPVTGWARGNGCFLIAVDVEAERVTGRVDEDAHVVLRLMIG